MVTKEKRMRKFGLLGRNIGYSFSKTYFGEKFKTLGITDASYVNFDVNNITTFIDQLKQEKNLIGFNITIPYKQEIIPFLYQLSPQASKIGAVNTVLVSPAGLVGHNTDAYGFKTSLQPLLKEHHTNALILGTGGASKAVAYVLEELGIEYTYVSRSPKKEQLNYSSLNKDIITAHTLLINCTPLGTHPGVDQKPAIPYQHLNSDHLLFDLIYNPAKTAFLAAGEAKGASIQNGLSMLEGQAEKAWELWNS